MNTQSEIENAMADVLLHPAYGATQAEYERLLAIMGNIDGNEVIALVIVACLHASDILERP